MVTTLATFNYRARVCLLTSIGVLACIASAHAELQPQSATQLTPAGSNLHSIFQFEFHPPTNEVLFRAEPDDGSAPPPVRLYRTPVTGGAIDPLTFQPADSYSNVAFWEFAPDGKHILFRQSDHPCCGDLSYLSLDPLATRQLTFGDRVGETYSHDNFQFSADGQRVVYAEYLGIFSAPVDGSSPPLQLSGELQGASSYGRFGNDWTLAASDQVLYMGDLETDGVFNLYSVDVGGGPSVRINATEGLVASISAQHRFLYNRDRNAVVYESRNGPTGRNSLFSRPLAAGDEIELTAGLAQSSDTSFGLIGFAGDEVLFASLDGTERNLYSAPIGGGSVRLINDVGGNTRLPSLLGVSPNEEYAIFSVANTSPAAPEVAASIYRFDFATGQAGRLGDFEPGGDGPRVSFAPNGDFFAIGGGLFPDALFTGAGDRVRALSGSSYTFHPDGEHLLRLGVVPAPIVHLQTQVFLERIDGAGQPIQLSDDGSLEDVKTFTLSRDGSVLLYLRGVSFSSSGREFLYSVLLVPEPSSSFGAAICFLGLCFRRRRRLIRPTDVARQA